MSHAALTILSVKTHGSRPGRPRLIGQLARLGGFCLLLGLSLLSAQADTGRVKKVIHQYALTSANDFPQRDPQNWRLLGSNDGGKTWTILDIRKNEFFTARQQRRRFQINNETAFETYRLQIDHVRDPRSSSSVQLAEIELMGRTEKDLEPEPIFTDIVSAQGDNPPAETAANLFDGRPETKWLDWSTNEVDRASWIQWQYAIPAETAVTNISQLQALRARAEDGFPIRLEAVAAGHKGNSLTLVDVTGCTELNDLAGTEPIRVGQKVSITGTSRWRNGQVGIDHGSAHALGPADNEPQSIQLAQSLAPDENLKWVELTGTIHYQHATKTGVSFDIQDNAGSMRVHLWATENDGPLPPPGTMISISGICLGAFNEQGQWVASELWAIGQDSLTILDPQIADASPTTAALPIKIGTTTTNSALVLTNIGQIRRLTQEQVSHHPHLKVRGVITGLLGGFIQDDTGGIEVDFPKLERRKLTDFGDYIEVEGSAESGDAGNPKILAEHITVLGRGKLPAPQKLSLSRLMSGHLDGQWIEAEGVVRSTDGAHLLIICDGQELMATLGVAATEKVDNLVDAEVRVRGVGVAAMDDQGRIQGIHLLIPSLEQVDVIEPPPDPAKLPVRPIGSLLGLSGLRESFHRVKVDCVVTLQENQKIFVQDSSGSAMAVLKENIVLDSNFGRSRWLYWQTPKAKNLPATNNLFQPGERVQIIGFPTTHRYSPVLTEVTINKLGVQQSVKPVAITDNDIEEGGVDSSLVTLNGVLRGQTSIGSTAVLAVEWQERTLQVLVPEKENDSLNIPLGSLLRVTGVCQVDPTPYPELGLGVGAVRILTRTANDLIVLAKPSWWTIQHALMLMGAMAMTILVALIWIKELRRQVNERSAQLSTQIQLRERTEHRHVLEQERSRIAKDLHDDLGANLTQIIFLSERVEVARHDGHDVTRWFNLIPATARRTIQSLDEIVWAINPQHDSLESLANYLSQFAQEYLTLARVRCVLDVPLMLPPVPLSAEVRHNLLLTTREALQNAVTHAAATEVRLRLKLNDDGLNISIADNGKGFDPQTVSAEANGLNNMHRRLEAIRGRLEINSRLNQGTTISLFVPKNVLHGRVIGGNETSS
ncbi:MAG TPA: ATP-binding protein [Verrucomicrobiae bacterium]|jgi:signal transduction histidine kinase